MSGKEAATLRMLSADSATRTARRACGKGRSTAADDGDDPPSDADRAASESGDDACGDVKRVSSEEDEGGGAVGGDDADEHPSSDDEEEAADRDDDADEHPSSDDEEEAVDRDDAPHGDNCAPADEKKAAAGDSHQPPARKMPVAGKQRHGKCRKMARTTAPFTGVRKVRLKQLAKRSGHKLVRANVHDLVREEEKFHRRQFMKKCCILISSQGKKTLDVDAVDYILSMSGARVYG